MDNGRLETTIQAIMNRQEVPQKRISVKNILSINGMSEYEYICCNRISEHLDDKHVILDIFNNCDIQLDYIGMGKCEYILKGYIPVDILETYEEYVMLENEIIENQNIQIRALRRCTNKELKNVIKEPERYFEDNNTINMFCRLVSAELKARRLHNRIKCVVIQNISKLVSYMQNYRTISIIKSLIAKYE